MNGSRYLKSLLICFLAIGFVCASGTHVMADINDGLVAYYPFNGNANDESGNGNNGTVNGATMTADRNGNANGAYYFDGSSNVILVDYQLPLHTFSIALWVKPDDIDSGLFEADQNNSPNYGHDRHLFLRNGNVCQRIWSGCIADEGCGDLGCCSSDDPNNDGNIDYAFCTDIMIQPTGYHLIVYVVKQNEAEIWINGNLAKSSFIMSSEFAYSNSISIGSSFDASNAYFNGIIDEVRIYNRTLSESDIQELYGVVKSNCPLLSLKYDEAQLDTMRLFRDEVLSQSPEGLEIIRLYYQWSPVVVKAMEADEEFKEDVKEMLDGVLPLIGKEIE